MKHRAIVHVTDDSSESCCMRCSGKILAGDTAVCTERFPDDNLRWHHKCFVCETCHLPLSQFIYFLQDSRIYCGRHHAELTRARCAACDQLIMSERCTIAEGLCWHVEHFCCWECEMVLGGSRYFLKGGRPFCSGCFQRFHAESCEACGEPVDPEGELVTFKGQYWHTLPSCFCCSSCRTPLQKSEFMAHDDNFYCSQHCLTLGSRLSFSSKYHINMIEPSSAKCNSYLHFSCHVTPGTPNSKQIKPLPHETCSATRCQEVIQRLFIDRDKESNKSWLPKHNQIIEVEEDSSCSSSDSEPEGFFLGRPIPSYSLNRESNSSVRGKSMDIKSRHRGKSCKLYK
ncbi:hypothetical protein GDO81_020670 [Engystomops pustulosus]|uniref:LIM zinc-binding domain-containing protein n=1 Tax=Engystomops pustulosus TaxID=76066 RepID=A0AAV6ZDW7_ENGPU|nr:hypothetical protein GDO81_020670 [Engystomops pustulosus]